MMLMQWFECVDQLSKNSQGFFLRQRSFDSHQIFQRSSLAVLIDQIDVICTFDHFYKFDNIDVILEQFKGLQLIFRKLC